MKFPRLRRELRQKLSTEQENIREFLCRKRTTSPRYNQTPLHGWQGISGNIIKIILIFLCTVDQICNKMSYSTICGSTVYYTRSLRYIFWLSANIQVCLRSWCTFLHRTFATSNPWNVLRILFFVLFMSNQQFRKFWDPYLRLIRKVLTISLNKRFFIFKATL